MVLQLLSSWMAPRGAPRPTSPVDAHSRLRRDAHPIAATEPSLAQTQPAANEHAPSCPVPTSYIIGTAFTTSRPQPAHPELRTCPLAPSVLQLPTPSASVPRPKQQHERSLRTAATLAAMGPSVTGHDRPWLPAAGGPPLREPGRHLAASPAPWTEPPQQRTPPSCLRL